MNIIKFWWAVSTGSTNQSYLFYLVTKLVYILVNEVLQDGLNDYKENVKLSTKDHRYC